MRWMQTTIAALSLSCLCAITNADDRAYRVIVNHDNALGSVDRQFLGAAFLKKATNWPNGTVVRPVDLPADSPVRARFSQEVLGRSVDAVKNYWQQAIFSGRDVPPPELTSEEEVVKYVNKYPGAVGYVSANADITGAKVINVR